MLVRGIADGVGKWPWAPQHRMTALSSHTLVHLLPSAALFPFPSPPLLPTMRATFCSSALLCRSARCASGMAA